MRIGLGHHPVGDIGGNAFRRRCGAAGKTRHRQVETTPEEMHGTRLADEARAKFVHHAIRLQQSQPEFLRVEAIILRMDAVALERDRVLDFTRHGPDVHLDAETAEALHEFGIEVGHRHRLEREVFDPAVARFDDQPMSGEVENDVERSSAIRHRRRNETARSHKERGIPPMIDERRERDAHLADDLRPQLQRVTGLAPRRER